MKIYNSQQTIGNLEVKQRFEEDGVFTAPYTGTFLIIAVGGGAGAGSFKYESDKRGGNAGETKYSLVELQKGEEYNVTIGAGGNGYYTGRLPSAGGNTIFGDNLVIASGGALNTTKQNSTDFINTDLAVELCGVKKYYKGGQHYNNNVSEGYRGGDAGFGGDGGMSRANSGSNISSPRPAQGWGAGGGMTDGYYSNGTSGYKGVLFVIGEKA